MNIRKHWGDWLQQTVGASKGVNYIQGYDHKGKLVKLTYTDKELPGLVESMFNVQRRKQ